MQADFRKKGCPNENCEQHVKKVKFSAKDDYCPRCGEKLIFVCARCFSEIEDISPKHRICSLCEAKAVQRKQVVKGKAIKVGKGAAAVAVGIIAKVTNDMQRKAVKEGTKFVEEAIQHIPRLIKK